MIDRIYIALTPFHFKSFTAKDDPSIMGKNALFFKENIVKLESLELEGVNIVEIIPMEFRIYDFFEDPLNSIRKYRFQIKEIKRFCEMVLHKYSLSENIQINIGSDRDIFTQVFLNTIYRKFSNKNIHLNAFEEGTGYYDKKTTFDHVKSVIFPILSPIFFGEKLHFNKPMGSDRRINTVFCRFPELIKKNRFSTYTKLTVRENLNYGEYNPESTKVLIFSFPLKDRDIAINDKVRWFTLIFNKYTNVEFVIKLHPREELFKIEGFPVSFLPSDYKIGDLNYFDYKSIVNFSSSILMDILMSGYPKKKILTIGFGADLKLKKMYEQTEFIRIEDLDNEN